MLQENAIQFQLTILGLFHYEYRMDDDITHSNLVQVTHSYKTWFYAWMWNMLSYMLCILIAITIPCLQYQGVISILIFDLGGWILCSLKLKRFDCYTMNGLLTSYRRACV